jgi:hypothetical protein
MAFGPAVWPPLQHLRIRKSDWIGPGGGPRLKVESEPGKLWSSRDSPIHLPSFIGDQEQQLYRTNWIRGLLPFRIIPGQRKQDIEIIMDSGGKKIRVMLYSNPYWIVLAECYLELGAEEVAVRISDTSPSSQPPEKPARKSPFLRCLFRFIRSEMNPVR